MTKEPVTILTFLWGDWCRPIGTQYVNALFYGIKRNINRHFTFIVGADAQNVPECIKKCDENILVQAIDSPSWCGCLPKLNAYNPDLDLRGKVLVFDLDSVVTGNIDPFIDAIDDGLTTRAWFKGIRRGEWLSGGDLLGFKAGWGTYLWEALKDHPDYVEHCLSEGGRERFVYRTAVSDLSYWQAKLPNKYYSYKNHIRGRGHLPKDCRIVSCHGHPRPHEINEKWIKEHWTC